MLENKINVAGLPRTANELASVLSEEFEKEFLDSISRFYPHEIAEILRLIKKFPSLEEAGKGVIEKCQDAILDCKNEIVIRQRS